MRILVTGGFGYLGGRIAKYLLKQGYQVVLGSRKVQPVPIWAPEGEVVQIDWNSHSSLCKACEQVDVVVHTAGMNAQSCEADPVNALEFNGAATARLVQASMQAKVTKFIYFSTVHVYQSSLHGEIDENHCPQNLHPYATSHKAAEDVVLYRSNNTCNMKRIVLRLSNGVGVPTHKNANCWSLAVNDFCRQVVECKRILINSPGEIERDFIPISFICEAVKTFIKGDNFSGAVVNVASSKALSLEKIVFMIQERARLVLGINPVIKFTKRGVISTQIQNNKLVISNKKISSSMQADDNIENEIDCLLIKCKEWFG
jgi:UDP-glucose 4-epimerase